jgi:3-hydroxyisobutyrate dehydrogenase-like beta-hydroxyacid dehydrogenase
MFISKAFRRFSSTPANANPMTIAWFGLGNMGKFMTKNLARSGHTVYAWDKMPQAEANCKDHVITGADPKEICARADMVITNITNTQAVHDFYVNQGFFDVIGKNAIICDTSTIDPEGIFVFESSNL